jgi:hypothetical protein
VLADFMFCASEDAGMCRVVQGLHAPVCWFAAR